MSIRRLVFFCIIISTFTSCGAAKKARIREQKINKVISTARSYIGTPYKWGGTTRGGMDCSGLLCNSFQAVKYTLPRTSADQSKVGEKVKRDKVQPGDLVFFATGKKKRKVTHVGMVTSVRRGKVMFIHSSSSLGVVESDMNSTYYKKRFRGARRPF
ncbi:NlpC/P60 family protein [Fulvivirga sp. M361]|uniref:C40 family peptidase n=1 Tax=Fulvivirga sp. M361 TaxID=2594266 RepID=UPI00117ACDD9|nr:C40 family peptidase [Fulvivirga sp. M361]TRX56156.1 NlpC/P60 family protein [Fulvivirga sp. M361]